MRAESGLPVCPPVCVCERASVQCRLMMMRSKIVQIASAKRVDSSHSRSRLLLQLRLLLLLRSLAHHLAGDPVSLHQICLLHLTCAFAAKPRERARVHSRRSARSAYETLVSRPAQPQRRRRLSGQQQPEREAEGASGNSRWKAAAAMNLHNRIFLWKPVSLPPLLLLRSRACLLACSLVSSILFSRSRVLSQRKRETITSTSPSS